MKLPCFHKTFEPICTTLLQLQFTILNTSPPHTHPHKAQAKTRPFHIFYRTTIRSPASRASSDFAISTPCTYFTLFRLKCSLLWSRLSRMTPLDECTFGSIRSPSRTSSIVVKASSRHNDSLVGLETFLCIYFFVLFFG